MHRNRTRERHPAVLQENRLPLTVSLDRTDGLRDPKKTWEEHLKATRSDAIQQHAQQHQLCLGQECLGIFTVKKDKMDVFEEEIGFLFSKMLRSRRSYFSLTFHFSTATLLDVICAKSIIIANVEA